MIENINIFPDSLAEWLDLATFSLWTLSTIILCIALPVKIAEMAITHKWFKRKSK